MKKLQIIFIGCLLSVTLIKAQVKFEYTPYLQAGGMYYSSGHITSAGIGPGIGLCLGISEHILAAADANIFWINGNSGSFRFALGYKRTGTWAPAVFVNTAIITGSRTEILLSDGSRPANPVFSAGLRLAPLRFENANGFVSVMEIGYGFGNYRGTNMEVSFLSVGLKL